MTEPKTIPDPRDQNGSRDDPRPDIQQAVEARSDAVARGEGGSEPAMFTDTGEFDGNSGTGGQVKNQDDTQQ